MNPGKLIVSEEAFEEKITISSTIPVLCDHNTECCITFKLDTDATTDISVQSMCDYKLCDKDWDPTKLAASIEVPIVANQDMIKDGNKQLLLTFEDLIPAGGGPYHRVFEGHQPSQIQVDVKDQDISRCSMTGDPHIHGFDYQTYHLYKTGDFVAYEVKQRDFQVMVRTWACGAVACICGVTIRERNDVIKINECDQAIHGSHTSPTVEIANKLSEGTIIQRSRNGRHIGVYLPSGSEIKLDVSNSHMNLFIQGPGTDKFRAMGLCGTNDGNPGNEFTKPDGSQDPVCPPGSRACIPDSFEEAWRSAPRDSLFENIPPLLPTQPEIKYCACKDNHHGSPAINCTVRANTPSSKTACHNCPTVTNRFRPNFLAGKTWTKRAAVFEDVDLPDALYTQADIPAIDPNRKWPNDQGITEGHALALCTQAIYKSQLVGKCNAMDPKIKDSFMSDCLADILHGGSTDFLDAITDAFTTDCQQTIAKEPSSYVSDPVTGERVMKPEYLGDICQTDCLEHGRCGPRGACICNAGWEGEFCHMQAGKGPILDKIRSGPLCDKSQRPCKRVFVDATNLDLSDDLACKIQEVDDQGKAVGKAVITEADFVSSTRISCEIPETNVSSRRYQVTATNDGALYGNALDLLVFDSTCLDCTGAGCTEKLTACHINEVCYGNGQIDTSDSSRQCVVVKNRTDWTILVTTARPQLEFFPTLSGPNVDFLMTCRFFPPADLTGEATIRRLVDGREMKAETLSQGLTEAFISIAQLPSAGRLTCEVGMRGASSVSGSVNLAVSFSVWLQ
ncbi:hypothetical protein RRG08_015408 [Elysia crispata]|uniref:VWFD domain-containing protein n=1 Tax=Elysia crispata TaxID=231223 RepID=A0AAE1D978_9GAST|nr:hypothetical protein RRG08_015408 [Elysia crispata]